MRIHYKIILALALALLAGSCASNSLTEDSSRREISLTPLHGASLNGVTLIQSAQSVDLSVSALSASGQFMRLSLPAGTQVSGQSWSNDSRVLRLLVPTPGGADLGLVPLSGYAGETVNIHIELGTGIRSVSTPPFGSSNSITDLAVSDAGAGLVNLHWTQINTGDYDFNGEVNIADITPLAQHLGNIVDRAAAGADQLTEFWLDGDKNGEVNLADLTPIGVYYTCYINGYNIKQNGNTIPGAGGQAPTVTRDQNTPHTGLPSTYDVQFAGSVTDSWLAASVDQSGTEGSDSGGGIGPADLVANLSITGQDLFNLVGSGTGPFGPGKFSSRVIDPIDIVDSTPIGQTSVTGIQTRVSGLPRSKTSLLRFYYAPTVDLATGAPKGGASIKGGAGLRNVSDVPESEQVVTSVPIDMPVTGSVGVDTNIDLSVNPAGGYFVNLLATITYPGDDPLTVPVETSYQRVFERRLSYATSLVAHDSDDDGEYEDEAEFEDSNRDCISDSKMDEINDDNLYEKGTEYELEQALIDSINLNEGALHLVECVLKGGGAFPAVNSRMTEETEFQLRRRTNDFPDGIGQDEDGNWPPLDPHELEGVHDPRLEVEADLYELIDPDTSDIVGYWTEKIVLVIDERT